MINDKITLIYANSDDGSRKPIVFCTDSDGICAYYVGNKAMEVYSIVGIEGHLTAFKQNLKKETINDFCIFCQKQSIDDETLKKLEELMLCFWKQIDKGAEE